jgi:hypothetical protein
VVPPKTTASPPKIAVTPPKEQDFDDVSEV